MKTNPRTTNVINAHNKWKHGEPKNIIFITNKRNHTVNRKKDHNAEIINKTMELIVEIDISLETTSYIRTRYSH